uniref:Uncharacterized protein LOC114324369 isoform X3 n=1 Tax=Diabrotica virgifera virgifera TaxID=50390 RepID=A0A6P7EYC8_DIAVI
MDLKVYCVLCLFMVVAVVDISESTPCCPEPCPKILCIIGYLPVKQGCCDVCKKVKKNGESCGGPEEVCANGLTCCDGVCGTTS